MIDTTLYDAFGQRQVSTIYNAAQPVSRRDGGRAGVLAEPGHADATSTCSTPTGAQVPLSAFAHLRPDARRRSAVNHQGSSPRRRSRSTCRPACRCPQATDADRRHDAAHRRAGRRFTARSRAPRARSRQSLDEPAAADPRGARSPSTSCSACSTRAIVHPLTILSTLPSAGVGALLALLLFKTEFSIIALIGVILLIGIVKKNAIMMIDFALDAERARAATAARRDLRGLRCCASGRS